MAVEIATLGIDLDTSKLKSGQAELRKVEDAGKRTADALDDAGKRGSNGLGSISRGITSLQAAIAGLGIGVAIRQVAAIGDEYAQVAGRLKLVTDSSAQLADVQEKLFGVAQRTGVAYTETANLYAKVAKNADQLGLSQQQLLDFTEITNQAIQVSGASAIEAAGGVRQLGQALASGSLRGDEFNSLAENMPRLRDAIADGLGKSIGELRAFAAEGKLTAEVVTQALLSQKGVIESEFAQLPYTVGRAVTELENEVKKSIASADMSPLTDSIKDLTKTLSDPEIVQSIQSLATGLVNLASFSVEAASAFSNLGTAIGEVAGEIATGEPTLRRFVALSMLINPSTMSAGWRLLRDDVSRANAEFGRTEIAAVDLSQGLNLAVDEADLLGMTTRAASQAMSGFNDVTKAAEDAAKKHGLAIAAANKSAADQLAALKLTNQMILAGVDADEAALRAKNQLAGINPKITQGIIEQNKVAKDHAEALEAEAAAIDAVIDAMERRNGISADLKSAKDQLYYLQQGATLEQARTLAAMNTLEVQAGILRAFGDQQGAANALAQLELIRANNANQYVADAQAAQKKWLEDGKDASAELAAEARANFEAESARISQSISDAIINGGLDSVDDLGNLLVNALKARTFQIFLDPVVNAAGQGINAVVSGGFSQLGGMLGLAGGFGGPGSAGYQAGVVEASAAYGTATVPSAAAGTSLGAIGIYAGAALVGWQLGSAAADSYRKRNKSISLNFIDGDVDASIKQERGAAGGRANSTDQAHKLDAQLSTQFGAMYDVIEEAGDKLGVTLDDFQLKLKAKIKGLSGDELNAKIADLLDDAAQQLGGQVIPNLERWKLANESAVDAVVRITSETLAYRRAFNDLGLTLRDGTQLSIESAQRLAVIAGGSDKLFASLAAFDGGFLTDAERAANLTAGLRQEIADLGLALPASRDGFRDLVTGIDLSTDANERAKVTLLGLSQAAANYYTGIETFFDTFATDAQRFTQLQAEVNDVFGRLGISVPRSSEQLYNYAAALDLNTEAGRAAIDILTQSTPALKEYFDTIAQALPVIDAGIAGNQELIEQGLATAASVDQVATARKAEIAAMREYAERQAAALAGVKQESTDLLSTLDTTYYSIGTLVTSLQSLEMQARAAGGSIGIGTETGMPDPRLGNYLSVLRTIGDALNNNIVNTIGLQYKAEQAISYTQDQIEKRLRRTGEGYKAYALAQDAWNDSFGRGMGLAATVFEQITQKVSDSLSGVGQSLDNVTEPLERLKSISFSLLRAGAENNAGAAAIYKANGTLILSAAQQAAFEVSDGFVQAIQAYLDDAAGLSANSGGAGFGSLVSNVGIGDVVSLENAYLKLTDALNRKVIDIDQYQELSQAAIDLFTGVAAKAKEAAEALAQQQAFIADIDKQIAQAGLSGSALELFNLDDQFSVMRDQYKDNAEALAKIEQLYGIKREQILGSSLGQIEEQWKGVFDSLSSYRQSLNSGDAAGLTAEQQYDFTRAQYNDVLALAQASDVDAAQQYQSVSEAFREASRNLFGSTAGYFSDLEGIKTGTDSVIGVAQFESDLPQQQAQSLRSIATSNVDNGKKIEALTKQVETLTQQLINVTAAGASLTSKKLDNVHEAVEAGNGKARAFK